MYYWLGHRLHLRRASIYFFRSPAAGVPLCEFHGRQCCRSRLHTALRRICHTRPGIQRHHHAVVVAGTSTLPLRRPCKGPNCGSACSSAFLVPLSAVASRPTSTRAKLVLPCAEYRGEAAGSGVVEMGAYCTSSVGRRDPPFCATTVCTVSLP